MQAGLNLFSIGRLIRTEPEFLQRAEQLKEMGYSFLQYSGAPYDPARIQRMERVVGLPVVLTHVPFPRITDETDALMREHESFGCRNIGLGAMPLDLVPDDEKVKAAVEKLEKAAAHMRRSGFRFFYHHHQFEFRKMADGTFVYDYILQNAPDINITLDTYWIQYGGVNILEYIRKSRGRIGCVHLKDYAVVQTAKDTYGPKIVPLGVGNLNFADIIAEMAACGTEYFLVEQDNACDAPDAMEQVGQSIRYLKNFSQPIQEEK